MSAARTLSVRRELLALAGLLLLVAVSAAMSAASPGAALALAAAAALTLAGLAVKPAAPRRAARRAPGATGEAAPTLRLTLPDGATLSARPVALPGESEHTMLLTRDGYVVVDAQGAVVHRL